mgnify:CR=1 FL=1
MLATIDFLQKHHLRKIMVTMISMSRPAPTQRVQREIRQAMKENLQDDRFIDQYIKENEYVDNEIIF